MWECAFTSLIESKAVSVNEKLNLLSQHLSGEPLAMISNYMLLQSEEGYYRARSELKNRYGNNAVISKAFLYKLESWPKIQPRDAPGLRVFSDFLNEIVVAKQKISDLGVLDYSQENLKLIKKVPYFIENKWRNIVQSYANVDSFPSFEIFTGFVRARADEANIPMFIQQPTVPRIDEPEKKHQRRQTSQSFATKVNVLCTYCTKDHHIDDCEGFNKLTRRDRKQYLCEHKLCYGCNVTNVTNEHLAYQCSNAITCKHCKNKHLSSLHIFKQNDKRTVNTSLCTSVTSKSSNTSMIVPVWFRSSRCPQNEILIYCILDPQSNTCFISDSIAEKLKLEGNKTNLLLSTMHSKSSVSCRKFSHMEVVSFDRKTVIPVPTVFSRDQIPATRSQIPTPAVASKWTHLNRISSVIVPYIQNVPIAMLIGNNVPNAIRPRDIIAGGEDEPYGQLSALGWGVVGTMCQKVPEVSVSNHMVASEKDSIVSPKNRLVSQTNAKEMILIMYELDFNDDKPGQSAMSADDRKFMDIMESNVVQRTDDHYEMPLPFKIREGMPNNRNMALKRLKQLKHKLNHNSTFKNDYMNFMVDVLENCSEKVPVNELDMRNGEINYVPHHGVYHPKKKKLCVVFDCSAEYAGTSLNKRLLQGPDMINNLFGVLTRFRKEPIAIQADVKGMFHQFFVSEPDRNFLRFLWWKDGSEEIVEHRMTVHLFGAVSSPAVANFGLRKAADDGESQYGKPVADFIRNDFYVDDGLKSLPSEADAIQLIDSSTKMCAKAGLTLHKWVTNNRQVLNSIPTDLRATDWKEISLHDQLHIERALGVVWCVETDTFEFRMEFKDNPVTRRGILSTLSAVYDPFGFLAPVLIVGKLILRELCMSQLDWDDPLPDEMYHKWAKWRNDIISGIENIKVKRCFKPVDFGSVSKAEMHFFSDASEFAYAQSSYIRLINTLGQVSVSFLLAKLFWGISEMKQESSRYLYLTAYNKFMTTPVPVIGITFHPHLIQVTLVQGEVSIVQLTNSTWLNGPPFLHTNEPLPTAESFVETADVDISDEMRKTTCVFSTCISLDLFQKWFINLCNNFSSWTRLRRVIARCLMCKKRLMDAAKVNIKQGSMFKSISSDCTIPCVDDIQVSGKLILKEDRKSDVQLKRSSFLYGLDPFLDKNQLIRVGGRVKRSKFAFDVKHPLILPKRCHLTKLIISHFHEQMNHAGKVSTLNEVRQQGYWIIHGLSTVGELVHRCVICRKLRGKLSNQKMADLPIERISDSAPFTYSGTTFG
ncbi:uncharacterized protein [Antedon mediterranea]|uniref:uncharacterized protein n=1 Tax=Antedon mediterranea TaxID=105859 RepID=UPI003AF9FC51